MLSLSTYDFFCDLVLVIQSRHHWDEHCIHGGLIVVCSPARIFWDGLSTNIGKKKSIANFFSLYKRRLQRWFTYDYEGLDEVPAIQNDKQDGEAAAGTTTSRLFPLSC